MLAGELRVGGDLRPVGRRWGPDRRKRRRRVVVRAEFRAAVVGAGPAGLLAAQELARHGVSVDVYEQRPAPGLKFLVAGRGGLNLTHAESFESFWRRYGGSCSMQARLTRFGPADVRAWAADLGVETFVGSSRRVFPARPAMDKAAPVLRRWLGRLQEGDVRLHLRHTWRGFAPPAAAALTPGLKFTTADGGQLEVAADAVLLALGGASWARLGSDGKWVDTLRAASVPVTELRPNNVGFQVDWPGEYRERYAGTPIKDVRLTFDGCSSAGDLMITKWGIEGGVVCALSSRIIAQQPQRPAVLHVDLRPSLSAADVAGRLARPRLAKASLSNRLRKALKLPPSATGLLRQAAADPEMLRDPESLGALIKAVPLELGPPQGFDTAISTSGGVAAPGLHDGSLMLKALPGVFAAGEMLDWDAPTGGYLLTGTLSTAHAAAADMLAWMRQRQAEGEAQ